MRANRSNFEPVSEAFILMNINIRMWVSRFVSVFFFLQFVEGFFEKYLERVEDPKVGDLISIYVVGLDSGAMCNSAVHLCPQETAGQVEIKALSLLYR